MDDFKKILILQNWLKKELTKTFETCLVNSSDCAGGIIAAHSVQKSNVLEKIAKGTGHVFRFSHNEETQFERIGINNASVFKGYCSKHDNNLFEYIDNNEFENLQSERASFLYALRTLSRELYAKISMIHSHEKLFDLFDSGKLEDLKKQFPFLNDSDLERILGKDSILRGMVEGNRLGKIELETTYNYFLEMLNKKQYHRVRTKVITIPKRVNLAAASMFAPEFDFNGNRVNQLGRLEVKLKSIFLTIIPGVNQSFVLISYMKKEEAYLENFLAAFDQSSLDLTCERIQKCLLIHCENSFYSEELIDLLNKKQKDFLYSFFRDSTVGDIKDFYIKKLPQDLNLF